MRHRRLPRIDLPHHTYFLTCCTHDRRPLLCAGHKAGDEAPALRITNPAEMLIGLYAGYRDRGDVRLHGYVVMPDHYHVLVTLATERSVTELVRKIHSAFARRYREAATLQGRVWQRRFYDHVIRDEDDCRTKLAYMHDNPVQRALVDEAPRYPWSSARFWLTGAGPVKCDAFIW